MWDVWLRKGDYVLFQVSLANRDTILSLHSSAELLDFFLHRIGEKHSVEKIMEHVVEGMSLRKLVDNIPQQRLHALTSTNSVAESRR